MYVSLINQRQRLTNVGVFLVVIFYVFQNALETQFRFFSYYEEIIALFGFLWGLLRLINNRIKKAEAAVVLLLLLFVAVGLVSNLVFGYQKIENALVDVFTNIKFWGNILFGYAVASKTEREGFLIPSQFAAKLCAVGLFLLSLADCIYNIFPSDTGSRIRVFNIVYKLLDVDHQYLYDTKKLTLFYFHGTYLVAAIILILVILLLRKEKNKEHLLYCFMCLCMLFLTGRSKALAAIVLFVMMFVIEELLHQCVHFLHLVAFGVTGVIVGFSKLKYFYYTLKDTSVRSWLTVTALSIVSDYFPLGTGFGTFASDQSIKHFSLLYYVYPITLDDININFFNDTMWPIIIAQTGAIGTIAYSLAMGALLLVCIKMQNPSLSNSTSHIQWGTLFGIIYLFFSSLGEPTFNNSVSMGIAFVIGAMLCNNYNLESSEETTV